MNMTPTRLTISPGSMILVTGANGYIASHVCDILLGMQYRVRGTVRSEKPWLNTFFNNKYGHGKFETAIVPSLDSKETWEEIIKGVSAVAHVASDLSMNADPHAVIPWVVQATVNCLEAASNEPSVKRVVLTSSSSAAILPEPNVEGVKVGQDTWNDSALEAVWSDKTPAEKKPFLIYAASKLQSERAAWNWIKSNQPRFGFNSVLPNMNLGRTLCPEVVGSTMARTAALLSGDDTAIRRHPPQWFVDVEDAARVHVVALLEPSVESQRIFAFAEPFNWTDITDLLRELRPDNRLIPQVSPNEGRDLTDMVDAPKAEQMIGDFFGREGWVGLRESLKAGLEGRW